MQQFVPFEDDWEKLEAAWAQALVPYRVGMVVAPYRTDSDPSSPTPVVSALAARRQTGHGAAPIIRSET